MLAAVIRDRASIKTKDFFLLNYTLSANFQLYATYLWTLKDKNHKI